MKKIIVSGAGGFLGNTIVEYCIKETDFEIYAVTSRCNTLSSVFEDAKGLHVFDRDTSLAGYVDNATILINCAFPRNADGVQMADGLRYTANLMQEVIGAGCGGVINISSQSVYSQKRIKPADEDAELNLESKYAVEKYAVELMVATICAGVPHTNIRLASMIGNRFEQRFTNKMVKQVLSGNAINIVESNSQFEFLDVLDAAAAVGMLLMSDCNAWEEVYNLSASQAYTLMEIAEVIAQIGSNVIGRDIPVKVDGVGEWQNSSLNCDRFMRQFGWKPQYRLTDTISDMFEYYKGEV